MKTFRPLICSRYIRLVLYIILIAYIFPGCKKKQIEEQHKIKNTINRQFNRNKNASKHANQTGIFRDISSKYSIEIHYAIDSTFFPGDWREPPVRAKAIPLDKDGLERFAYILKISLSKYPEDLIKKNLTHIFIVKKLFFHQVEYGATYFNDMIYLSRNGYSDDDLIDTFHHEFSSILLNNYKFSVDEWRSCNPDGFSYSNVFGGGRAILQGKASLFGSAELYKQGFLNEYSKSSFEEDFNVFSGMILTKPELFEQLMKKYPIFKKKFYIWLAFYHSIDIKFTEDYIFDKK